MSEPHERSLFQWGRELWSRERPRDSPKSRDRAEREREQHKEKREIERKSRVVVPWWETAWDHLHMAENTSP